MAVNDARRMFFSTQAELIQLEETNDIEIFSSILSSGTVDNDKRMYAISRLANNNFLFVYKNTETQYSSRVTAAIYDETLSQVSSAEISYPFDVEYIVEAHTLDNGTVAVACDKGILWFDSTGNFLSYREHVDNSRPPYTGPITDIRLSNVCTGNRVSLSYTSGDYDDTRNFPYYSEIVYPESPYTSIVHTHYNNPDSAYSDGDMIIADHYGRSLFTRVPGTMAELDAYSDDNAPNSDPHSILFSGNVVHRLDGSGWPTGVIGQSSDCIHAQGSIKLDNGNILLYNRDQFQIFDRISGEEIIAPFDHPWLLNEYQHQKILSPMPSGGFAAIQSLGYRGHSVMLFDNWGNKTTEVLPLDVLEWPNSIISTSAAKPSITCLSDSKFVTVRQKINWNAGNNICFEIQLIDITT